MVQSVCHHQSAVQKDLYGNWKVLIIQKRNARFISSYLSIRGAEDVPVKVKTTIVVQGERVEKLERKKRYETKKTKLQQFGGIIGVPMGGASMISATHIWQVNRAVLQTCYKDINCEVLQYFLGKQGLISAFEAD